MMRNILNRANFTTKIKTYNKQNVSMDNLNAPERYSIVYCKAVELFSQLFYDKNIMAASIIQLYTYQRRTTNMND